MSSPVLPGKPLTPPRFPTLEDVEREHIKKALELFGHNKSETARQLNIARATLHRKIRELGL